MADTWNAEKKLIMAVEKKPILYDQSRKDYKDTNARDASWKAVSLEVQMSAEECQKMWRRIRDRYVKLLKTYLPSGSGTEGSQSNWELFQFLKFLQPCIKKRKTISNTEKENVPTFSENVNVDTHNMTFVSETDMTESLENFEEIEVILSPSLIQPVEQQSEPTSSDCSRKRKRKEPDDFEREVLAALMDKKSVPPAPVIEQSSNRDFMMSLVPYLDKLSEEKCSLAKIKMLTLLHDMMYG